MAVPEARRQPYPLVRRPGMLALAIEDAASLRRVRGGRRTAPKSGRPRPARPAVAEQAAAGVHYPPLDERIGSQVARAIPASPVAAPTSDGQAMFRPQQSACRATGPALLRRHRAKRAKALQQAVSQPRRSPRAPAVPTAAPRSTGPPPPASPPRRATPRMLPKKSPVSPYYPPQPALCILVAPC